MLNVIFYSRSVVTFFSQHHTRVIFSLNVPQLFCVLNDMQEYPSSKM